VRVQQPPGVFHGDHQLRQLLIRGHNQRVDRPQPRSIPSRIRRRSRRRSTRRRIIRHCTNTGSTGTRRRGEEASHPRHCLSQLIEFLHDRIMNATTDIQEKPDQTANTRW
jgi:hypothetical protein